MARGGGCSDGDSREMSMRTTCERRDGGVDEQAGGQAAVMPVQAGVQARRCPAPVMPRPRRLTSAEREVLRAARVFAASLDDGTPQWTFTCTRADLVAAASVVTP